MTTLALAMDPHPILIAKGPARSEVYLILPVGIPEWMKSRIYWDQRQERKEGRP